MASTPLHCLLPAGLTLTIELYPEGSDTIANGSGDTLTEQANRLGLYIATVTEALVGTYYGIVKDGGSNVIATGVVTLADTTAIHRLADPSENELTGETNLVTEITVIEAD